MPKRSNFVSVRDSAGDQFRGSPPDEYNLLFRLSMPREGEKNWTLEYFMQSKRDQSLLYPLIEAENSKNPILKYCTAKKLSEVSRISGFAAAEISGQEEIREMTTDEAFLFLKHDAFRLRENGFVVHIPKNLDLNSKRQLGVKFNVTNVLTAGKTLDSQLLEFDYSISLGDAEISADEFMAIVQSKSHLVKVRERWVEVNQEDANKVMKLLQKAKEKKNVKNIIAIGIEAAGEGIQTEVSQNGDKLESIIDAIPEARTEQLSEPEGFVGELRPYQRRGIGWLDFLSRVGLGALLADDMGLGKTVQVIAHCMRILKDGRKPILIICPTSVIGNWMDEFHRFSPGIKVLIHHGSERNQGKEFEYEAKEADVLISSYALAWRDLDEFNSIDWAMIVLDEAQNIKNPFAKQTQSIKKLRGEIRIALSGTPIENRLSELWSIMEFLNPGYLDDWKEFRDRFARPIEADSDIEKKQALKKAISPFVLRRLKTDQRIISDLPDKNEIIEWCSLTAEQATLYGAVVEASIKTIEAEKDNGVRQIQIFAAITKLKQICNHPANMLKDSSELGDRSGKIERLRELLETMIENGESCLIFSQYTEMAQMLYRNLEKEFGAKAKFDYLHGGLGREERDRITREFQQPNELPKILILSLKAGGSGLNLTGASNVIHFDRWWNPAIENQATDRAYRIGQEKNVFVYKLTTKGTIEEKIDKIIEQKKLLADSIIGDDENILIDLDTKKLKELLEYKDE